MPWDKLHYFFTFFLGKYCFAIQMWLHLQSILTGVVFPSLLQLHRGINEVEDRKQKHLCATRYKPKDLTSKGKRSEIDIEREEECGICMEMNSKVVLPNCNHSMCMKCYRDWWANFDYIFLFLQNTSNDKMVIRLNIWVKHTHSSKIII